MKDNIYSRRKFISKYLTAGALFSGALTFISIKALAQTKPKPKTQTPKKTTKTSAHPAAKKTTAAKPAAVDPCDDYTGVSASDLDKRRKMAYVTQSPIPDSHCENCALHLPAAESKKECLGCMLFKGPVRPTGYCTYWAAIPAAN